MIRVAEFLILVLCVALALLVIVKAVRSSETKNPPDKK